jgi:hypothetical protein
MRTIYCMKHNLLISVILFTSLSSLAVGDFSGHWVAEGGEVTSDVGLNSKCSRVEIVIEQTQSAVITQKYSSSCNLFSSEWGPMEQLFADGKIYEQGEEVGTIDDSSLTSIAPSGTAFYLYNMRLVPGASGEIELESEYGVKNAVGTILTTARLKRQ